MSREAKYTLTKTPRDPYVGLVVSLLVLLSGFVGELPEDVSREDIAAAVEAIGAGGVVLFSVAASVWRRRVRRGNDAQDG